MIVIIRNSKDKENHMTAAIGFMEAMVAMMVVVTALMVYLSSAGALLVAGDDPVAGFDTDSLGLDYGDRRLEALSEDYIRGFVDGGSASGVLVVATMPGTDFGDVMFSYGDMTGHRSSAVSLGITECGSGRWMATVFEVTVCA